MQCENFVSSHCAQYKLIAEQFRYHEHIRDRREDRGAKGHPGCRPERSMLFLWMCLRPPDQHFNLLPLCVIRIPSDEWGREAYVDHLLFIQCRHSHCLFGVQSGVSPDFNRLRFVAGQLCLVDILHCHLFHWHRRMGKPNKVLTHTVHRELPWHYGCIYRSPFFLVASPIGQMPGGNFHATTTKRWKRWRSHGGTGLEPKGKQTNIRGILFRATTPFWSALGSFLDFTSNHCDLQMTEQKGTFTTFGSGLRNENVLFPRAPRRRRTQQTHPSNHAWAFSSSKHTVENALDSRTRLYQVPLVPLGANKNCKRNMYCSIILRVLHVVKETVNNE